MFIQCICPSGIAIRRLISIVFFALETLPMTPKPSETLRSRRRFNRVGPINVVSRCWQFSKTKKHELAIEKDLLVVHGSRSLTHCSQIVLNNQFLGRSLA